MIREKKENIITFISYKQSMLLKIVACLLICTFSITNLTYGLDRDTLDRIRSRESELQKVVEERIGRPQDTGRESAQAEQSEPVNQSPILPIMAQTAAASLATLLPVPLSSVSHYPAQLINLETTEPSSIGSNESDLWGNGRPQDGSQDEMDEIVQSMLKRTGPSIIKIRDIKLWKHFQKVIGREGAYLIGCAVDIPHVLAAQWKKANHDATPDDYWRIKTAFEQETPLQHRWKIFIYSPFDDGGIEFHETLHYSMSLRAVSSGTYISRKSDDVLFEQGTESRYVRELQKMAGWFPDTKETFDELVDTLRRYPPSDLSQELFAWIFSLERYSDYITHLRDLLKRPKPQIDPNSEEGQYLQGYFRETEATASVMLEPTERFVLAARRHPEIREFLREYYKRLHEFTIGTHFLSIPPLDNSTFGETTEPSSIGSRAGEKKAWRTTSHPSTP